ncbi:SIS domain-containing protein [bacterium]|nr:SIS domain-containing protein [bacterium]
MQERRLLGLQGVLQGPLRRPRQPAQQHRLRGDPPGRQPGGHRQQREHERHEGHRGHALPGRPRRARARGALCAAPRIDFYGAGTSGLVALDASNKFVRINKFTVAHADPHEQMLSATSLRPGDVAVLFSYSGETRDTIETCEIVKATGATVITVTRYGRNLLNEMADIKLSISSAESMIRSGAMGSRIGQLTMVDILYTAVCSRLYDQVKPYLDKTRLTSQRKHSRPRR